MILIRFCWAVVKSILISTSTSMGRLAHPRRVQKWNFSSVHAKTSNLWDLGHFFKVWGCFFHEKIAIIYQIGSKIFPKDPGLPSSSAVPVPAGRPAVVSHPDGSETAQILRFDWEVGAWVKDSMEIPAKGGDPKALSEGLKVLIGAGKAFFLNWRLLMVS